MKTALQDLSLFDEIGDARIRTNRVWVDGIIHDWEKSLPTREAERRKHYSTPPSQHKPITDDQVEEIRERIAFIRFSPFMRGGEVKSED
jgi:hypothetical protein